MRAKFLRYALLLALGMFLATSGHAQQSQPAKPAKASKKATAPVVEPVLEPKAIEILKAASDRLAAARAMRFTAVISYESPSRLGPPLVYTTTSEVTLQRPDKLRVITPGDGPASEFYYDGKTMMAFAPAENLVAVADAPPTIDAALKAAYDTAAIYFPFTDVIVADPYKDLADGLEARLLHRPIPRRRRHDDGHGGDRQRLGVRTDLDRGRRQAAAQGPRGVPRRSVAAAPRDGVVQLATRCDRPGGRLRVVERHQRDAHRVHPPGPEAPAGPQAAGAEQAIQISKLANEEVSS